MSELAGYQRVASVEDSSARSDNGIVDGEAGDDVTPLLDAHTGGAEPSEAVVVKDVGRASTQTGWCFGRADADRAATYERPLDDQPVAPAGAVDGETHLSIPGSADEHEAGEEARKRIEAARLGFKKQEEEGQKLQQQLEAELRECDRRVDDLRQSLAQEEQKLLALLDEMPKGTDWIEHISNLADEVSSLKKHNGTAAKLMVELKTKADIVGKIELKMRERDLVNSARLRFEHQLRTRREPQIRSYLKRIDCLWCLQTTGVRYRRAARRFLTHLRLEDSEKLSLTSVLATNVLLAVVCSITIMMMPSNTVKVFTAIVVGMCYLASVVREKSPTRNLYLLGGVYLMCLTTIPSVLVSSGSGAP